LPKGQAVREDGERTPRLGSRKIGLTERRQLAAMPDKRSPRAARPAGRPPTGRPGSPGPGGGEGGPGKTGTVRETGVATRTRPKTKKPSMYRVLLLNDDYTPMEFVVLVLEFCFQKSREDATRIMLHVHNHGVGVCGVYPYEVAETKVAQVLDLARQHEHPLQCTMERED
jgi:ATP-dependent Clp protease adaptor protein ClpS